MFQKFCTILKIFVLRIDNTLIHFVPSDCLTLKRIGIQRKLYRFLNIKTINRKKEELKD